MAMKKPIVVEPVLALCALAVLGLMTVKSIAQSAAAPGLRRRLPQIGRAHV